MPTQPSDNVTNLLQFKAAKKLRELKASAVGGDPEYASKIAMAKELAKKLRLRSKSTQAETLSKVGSANSVYKHGRIIPCRIVSQEFNGYSVLTTKDNLPGHLVTKANHQINGEILAVFVCVHRGRLLFDPLIPELK